MNKNMRVAIIAGRAGVTCSSPSTVGRAARRDPDSRRQVMPEPQEVGPPDINDLLQPRFATSFENRVGADAGIDGSKADRVRGGSHRSHRASMESEKEPHKNACTVSFRRADFSIAARLGRLVAMGMGATWELIRYPAL